MGGKQSKGKQDGQQIPQRETKEQWEEDWETFLSSHPAFTVNDVNWEENLMKDGNEDQIRLVCISDTHCQVFNPILQQDKHTGPGTDNVGAGPTRGHLDTRWRLHQLWEKEGGGKVQPMVGDPTPQVVETYRKPTLTSLFFPDTRS